ncbi:ankyrin repeat-containing domain protein [Whalleya microplaca]|nr:ankyrin repeat-containing domain protein [Whalleya microplaca]
MEINIQLPSDPVERRRLQNRIAQRRFRQKRDQRRGVGEDVRHGAAVITAANTSPSNSSSQSLPQPQPHPLLPTPDSSSHDAPPLALTGADNVNDLWDLDGLGGATSTSALPLSPSQFLYDLGFAFPSLSPAPPPSAPTTNTNTNTNTNSDPSHSHSPKSNPIRKPLHHRRSAQLTPSTANPLLASPSGWLGPLHIAAVQGHARLLRVLLATTTTPTTNSPSTTTTDPDDRDSEGRTPLMYGVIAGHGAVVSTLLAQGARVGVVDRDGRSAVHWAALGRRAEALGMLLERVVVEEAEEAQRSGSSSGGSGGSRSRSTSASASGSGNEGGSGDGDEHKDRGEEESRGYRLDIIDAYDDAGWTPLHMAIHQDFEAGVRLLLQCGASLNSKAQKCPFAGRFNPPDEQTEVVDIST